MRYSDYQQRQLDVESGKALDRAQPIALGTTVILVNSDPLIYAVFSDPGWHVVKMRMDDSAVHSSTSDYPSFIEAKRALDSNQITWEA